MLNQQIISVHTEALELTHTVSDALRMMEDLGVTQVPVVKDGLYLGLISEDDLLDASNTDQLALFEADLLPFSVNAEDHFFSAAKLATSQKLKLVPVISNTKELLGLISQEDLVAKFARLTGVQEAGAILIIAMSPSDYSISQLAKLVETNDAYITQLNTFLDEASGQLMVNMRINKEEISDVVATFQRYDYQIIFHAGEEAYENELRRNFNHLMTYLEM